jgi:hypothetical protein
MMRRLATLIILIGMTGFAVPSSFCQEKESAAQERREQKQVDRDVPAEMQRARQALETAKSELEHAGGEWGGHRATAIGHINQALAEVHKAEEFAKQHKLAK